jgi:hypothetical protein
MLGAFVVAQFSVQASRTSPCPLYPQVETFKGPIGHFYYLCLGTHVANFTCGWPRSEECALEPCPPHEKRSDRTHTQARTTNMQNSFIGIMNQIPRPELLKGSEHTWKDSSRKPQTGLHRHLKVGGGAPRSYFGRKHPQWRTTCWEMPGWNSSSRDSPRPTFAKVCLPFLRFTLLNSQTYLDGCK